MLDYKNIIIKRYGANLTGAEIARQMNISKSGVNDFIKAFEQCDRLPFPLPEGITNYGIYELVYGHAPNNTGRNENFEEPDFAAIHDEMSRRKNMTLTYLWNKYYRDCTSKGGRPYQYRRFCGLYSDWCEENQETLHFSAVKGQKMEVDFAGKTFFMSDKFTGEAIEIVVFVAILPYSQYIYAEGMFSTKEPQWIEVNNRALEYFGGVPAIVVCDNCKQAVIANRDWIAPDLNKDYCEWAEHNHTVILPAKVKKPKYKSSVENAVGILEKGIFHDLEDQQFFTIQQFNEALWKKLELVNTEPFKKKEHNRRYYWEEEKAELMPLPSMQYKYMERKVAKVSSDFHVRFDNAYYSVDKAFLHKQVSIGATATAVKIYSLQGELLYEWPRATHPGQWQTDPKHLPLNYTEYGEWSGTSFIKKAMTIGPYTTKVIKAVLVSKKVEVQTYRSCIGILNFAKKYSNRALESCCERALAANKLTYTFIKNTIVNVAEELGASGFNTKVNDQRNQGAFVMDASNMDINHLLQKSEGLARSQKEAVDENK